MKYTYQVEEYEKMFKDYEELERLAFLPGEEKEKVLAALEERSRRKREIADAANTMIREYVETYEKEPEKLTPEGADTLLKFIEILMPPTIPHGFDTAVAFRVSRILLDYYRKTGETEKYAAALFRCMVSELSLFSFHSLSGYAGSPYREEVLALAEKYGELPPVAARTALRALTMSLFSQSKTDYGYIRKTVEVLKKAIGDKISPDINEDILFTAYSNVINMFSADCELAGFLGEPFDIGEKRGMIASMTDFIERNYAQNDVSGQNAFVIRCALYRTKFHLGELTLENFLERMIELQSEGDVEDPVANITQIAFINNYYLQYLRIYGKYSPEETERLGSERIREVMPRIMNTTRMVNNISFNYYIVNFLLGAALYGSFDDFSDILLELTVYADKPLYIHTEMVRRISLVIFDKLIEVSPEVFDGTAGRDAEYIRTHREEMRALLSECCLFHDIGKFFMLDIVENSMRRLTDEEFSIIKQHPTNFDDIYPLRSVRDERVRCIRDCAMTHHLWHDGTRGYPMIPQTKNRPFSDILAIADGLDAATDTYGRPYRSRKSLDVLIGEFQSGAGTQYGPEAAAVLSDPDVQKKLAELIDEGRKEVCYRIYTFGKI